LIDKFQRRTARCRLVFYLALFAAKRKAGREALKAGIACGPIMAYSVFVTLDRDTERFTEGGEPSLRGSRT
jgi:hypothetical protein